MELSGEGYSVCPAGESDDLTCSATSRGDSHIKMMGCSLEILNLTPKGG